MYHRRSLPLGAPTPIQTRLRRHTRPALWIRRIAPPTPTLEIPKNTSTSSIHPIRPIITIASAFPSAAPAGRHHVMP